MKIDHPFHTTVVRPIGRLLLVEFETYEKTASGLFLPEGVPGQKDNDIRQRCRVVAKGKLVSDEINVGDYIRFAGGKSSVIPTPIEDQFLLPEDRCMTVNTYEDDAVESRPMIETVGFGSNVQVEA